MPFKIPLLAQSSNGGTEITTRALIKGLEGAGRKDLLDFFDFYPSRIDEFDPTRPSVYWIHDMIKDPCFEHFWADKGRRFQLMTFVSDWQHQQFMSEYRLQGHNTTVIANGFYPFADDIVRDKWSLDIGTKDNPLRLIYHTTPHRGLEILVPVYEVLYERFQEAGIHIHLDVYSSFKIYGWAERDEPYDALFQTIKDHPGMAYHGSVSNQHVRRALEEAHVFAFPSIWPETFCIAAVEAMSAGVIPVHSNLGALPTTTGGYSVMYPHAPDLNLHANRFFETLYSTCLAIVNDRNSIMMLPALAAQRVNLLYSWNAVVPQWITALDSVKAQLTTAQE